MKNTIKKMAVNGMMSVLALVAVSASAHAVDLRVTVNNNTKEKVTISQSDYCTNGDTFGKKTMEPGETRMFQYSGRNSGECFFRDKQLSYQVSGPSLSNGSTFSWEARGRGAWNDDFGRPNVADNSGGTIRYDAGGAWTTIDINPRK